MGRQVRSEIKDYCDVSLKARTPFQQRFVQPIDKVQHWTDHVGVLVPTIITGTVHTIADVHKVAFIMSLN